mmetsp:Transcript_44090/g.110667  ORF Transcript_44090/g.110667 Transcript_44090/m.110667 type:complete len:377 (+) Transcript_44090:40-1170(+)
MRQKISQTWFPQARARWSHQLRTPGTGRRWCLKAVTAWTIGLTIAVWVMAFTIPCDFRGAAMCGHPMAASNRGVQQANLLGAYMVLIGMYIYKLLQIRGYKRLALQTGLNLRVSDRYAVGEKIWSDGMACYHWTGAASQDVYTETVTALLDIQRLILPIVVAIIFTNTVVKVSVTILGHALDDANYLPDHSVCNRTPNPTLCNVTWECELPLLDISISLLLYMICLLVLMPDYLWSPVMKAAIQATGNRHVGRLRHLHKLLAFPVLFNFVILGVYAAMPSKTYWGGIFVFSGNLLMVMYGTLAVAWLYLLIGRGDRHQVTPGIIGSASSDRPSSLRMFATALSRMVVSREAGIRSQRVILLILLAVLFAPRERFWT